MSEKLGAARSAILLFSRAARSSMANAAAYRGDFIIGLAVTLLFELLTPLATILIYRSSSMAGFPGWKMEEVLVLQAVFLISRGIAFPLFFGVVWVVFNLVREGRFELILLRPRSPLLVALSQGLDVPGFVRLVGGLVLLLWSAGRLDAIQARAILPFLLMLGLSVLTLFACALFMSGSLFVWVGNSRVSELLDSILLFAQYPGSIFSSGAQLIMAVVVPVSMVALFPAEVLLGRSDALLLPATGACLAFFALGLAFWNHMSGKYTGAGG
jgi:ABC-2 type transport system permease protein